MNPKKLLALVLALMLALALAGCQASNEETPDALGVNSSQPAPGDQQEQPGNQGGSQQGGVDFGLQQAPDPNFDSPASGGSGDKIYTIVGDYAYEMDPNTLEIVGPPLDPITHEPVDNPVLDGENPSTPNNPQNSAPPASEPPASQPPASDPPATSTPDTSLPNTGMFLEDD